MEATEQQGTEVHLDAVYTSIAWSGAPGSEHDGALSPEIDAPRPRKGSKGVPARNQSTGALDTERSTRKLHWLPHEELELARRWVVWTPRHGTSPPGARRGPTLGNRRGRRAMASCAIKRVPFSVNLSSHRFCAPRCPTGTWRSVRSPRANPLRTLGLGATCP